MKKFKIYETEAFGQNICKIELSDKTWFSFFPEYGGAMHELVINEQQVLETAIDSITYNERTINAYGGAQLFPFPNRIRDGKFNWNKKTWQLNINDPAGNNTLHGFVYNQHFEIKSKDEENGSVTTNYSYNDGYEGYPFKFSLENTYQLNENGMSIKTKIINDDDVTVPIGHGWHPYFSIGEDISEAQLQLNTASHFPNANDYLPQGFIEGYDKYVALAELNNQEFNHCFLMNHGSEEMARLYFPSKELLVKVCSTSYQYLQVYIPPNRNSIAIEPQSAIPDAFNNGTGLITLLPKAICEFDMQILIERG